MNKKLTLKEFLAQPKRQLHMKIPEALFERIDKEAELNHGGLKSLFITKLLLRHFNLVDDIKI